MATTQNVIDETLLEVLSGQREQRNRLTNAISDTDTTLQFDFQLDGIQQGATLTIGLEILTVWQVTAQSRTAIVQRGMSGSIAAAHTAGAVATVNARFPGWTVLGAVNNTLRSLSSPACGLYAMRDVLLTTDAVRVTYDLLAADQVLSIYDIAYDLVGTDRSWPTVKRYRLLRNMPAGDFTSGYALKIDEDMQPGRRLRVLYKAPFTELQSLDDDVELTTGLSATALDLLPLGAQMILMNRREAKRTFTEAQPDTRRATEVGVGSSTRAYGTLKIEWDRRVGEERARLQRQYPERRLV